MPGPRGLAAIVPAGGLSPAGPIIAAVLVLLVVSVAPLPAQTVHGTVLDPDGNALAGATLSLRLETGHRVARVGSDQAGRFTLGPVGPGVYGLVVGRIGYQSTTSALALKEGETIEVELRLAVEAIPMDPIVVRASPRPPWEYTEPPALWEFWERRHHYEKLGLGSFITEKDLNPFLGQKISHTVANLHPFLNASPHSYRPSTVLIRGRSGCKPLIFIDGHLVSPRQPMEGFDPQATRVRGIRSQTLIPDSLGRGEESMDDFISAAEVAAVEVYRGASGLPGEFHSGLYSSTCGAVVIWSRRGIRR